MFRSLDDSSIPRLRRSIVVASVALYLAAHGRIELQFSGLASSSSPIRSLAETNVSTFQIVATIWAILLFFFISFVLRSVAERKKLDKEDHSLSQDLEDAKKYAEKAYALLQLADAITPQSSEMNKQLEKANEQLAIYLKNAAALKEHNETLENLAHICPASKFRVGLEQLKEKHDTAFDSFMRRAKEAERIFTDADLTDAEKVEKAKKALGSISGSFDGEEREIGRIARGLIFDNETIFNDYFETAQAKGLDIDALEKHLVGEGPNKASGILQNNLNSAISKWRGSTAANFIFEVEKEHEGVLTATRVLRFDKMWLGTIPPILVGFAALAYGLNQLWILWHL